MQTNKEDNPHLIRINLLGRSWLIERPASLEELWDKLTENEPRSDLAKSDNHKFAEIGLNNLIQDFEEDDRIPYWTEIWPAGIALAEWIAEQKSQIEKKLCLDLGCGLGFSSAVGAYAGAHVLGMDYEPLALYYAARNCRKNLCSQPESQSGWVQFITADWRKPAFKKGAFSLIWAGDIMYEQRFMAPVATFLCHCLATNGKVWIAEPGRGIYPEFARMMQSRGWRAEIVTRKQASLPGNTASPANIQIWELSRKVA